MPKLTVVAGLFTKDIDRPLKEFLNEYGYDILATTDYGFELVNAVLKTTPDIVFADVALYDVDGEGSFGILKEYDFPNGAVCVCVCSKENIEIANKSLKHGADTVVAVPFDGTHLNRKLRDLIAEKADRIRINQRKKFLRAKDRDIKNRIYSLLRDLGVFANHYGYKYVRRAVLESINDPSLVEHITKKLYPLIAEVYGTSSANVERSIRHCVKTSWTTGNLEVLHSVFGDAVAPDSEGPTNGEFISMVAEKIKFESESE